MYAIIHRPTLILKIYGSRTAGIYVCLSVSLPLTKRQNDTDLKFGTHPALEDVQQGFFSFVASLEKLPLHVDFRHLSPIALFFMQILECKAQFARKNGSKQQSKYLVQSGRVKAK